MLILSASMGAGHDGVAAELAARLTGAGVEAEVVDVLRLLPARLGPGLRRWYGWMMRRAPWMYAAIYRVFFVADRAPPTSPLTVLAAARLRRLLGEMGADRGTVEIVSTFHLAAQAAGHLRRRGGPPVLSTVLVTDFAVHRLWLHPGNDRYLCLSPAVARGVAAALGRPVSCHAPVARPGFGRPASGARRVLARIGVRPEDRPVLVSAGSWGVGRIAETARVLRSSGRYAPVVLCGRNDGLRYRLTDAGLGPALGWRDDIPELMGAAYAMIDNAAGLTCVEAFAAGLPVISYRPIPGHGRDGATAMARAGLSVFARDDAGLLAALDALEDDGVRERHSARAAALFDAEPVERAFVLVPGEPVPGGIAPA